MVGVRRGQQAIGKAPYVPWKERHVFHGDALQLETPGGDNGRSSHFLDTKHKHPRTFQHRISRTAYGLDATNAIKRCHARVARSPRFPRLLPRLERPAGRLRGVLVRYAEVTGFVRTGVLMEIRTCDLRASIFRTAVIKRTRCRPRESALTAVPIESVGGRDSLPRPLETFLGR